VKHEASFFELAGNYKLLMAKYSNSSLDNLKIKQMKYVDNELEKTLTNGSLKFSDDQIISNVYKRLNDFQTPKHDPVELNKFLIKTKTQFKRQVALKRGLKIESHVRDHLNNIWDYNFKSSSEFNVKDYGIFKIRGYFDGFDAKNSTILEVKSLNNTKIESYSPNRQQKIQMLAYMDLYSCNKCLFVCAKSNGDLIYKEIPWNEREFKSLVQDKLDEFTKRIREMTERDFINLMILCKF
jgi:hypothetical protein